MVINHLLTGMILQVTPYDPPSFINSEYLFTWSIFFLSWVHDLNLKTHIVVAAYSWRFPSISETSMKNIHS